MPGSKVNLGNGKYRLYVNNGFRPDGKPNRATRTVEAKSDRAAEKLLEAFYAEFTAKPPQTSNKTIFRDFAEIWFKKHEQYLSPNSQHGDMSMVNQRLVPYFGNMRLTKITETHITGFFEELALNPARLDKRQGQLSAGSMYNLFRVLRSMLNKAVEWGYISHNPCNSLPKDKRPKKKFEKPPILEDEELKIFLKELFGLRDNATNTKHQLFFYLSLLDGGRLGEHIGLCWHDVDFEKHVVHIRRGVYTDNNDGKTKAKSTKNGLSRVVYVDDRVLELFRKHKVYQEQWLSNNGLQNPEQYVFLKTRLKATEMPTRSMFWHWLDSFLRKHGLKHIGVHGFRRMAASYSLRNNVPLTDVKDMLGHKDIATTNIYLRSLEDSRRAGANNMSKVYASMIGDEDK